MGDRRLPMRVIGALGGVIVCAAIAGGGIALAADQAVAISGFSFAPGQITVAVGDTITWTNSDAQAHRVIADDASWDAGVAAGSGGTASAAFPAAGVFPYHCSIHPEMIGTVTVAAAGATAPATDTAAAEAPSRLMPAAAEACSTRSPSSGSCGSSAWRSPGGG